MIKKITISNEASYGKEPVVISDLKEINYFFGANASGKTTISRVIEKKKSNIEWSNTPLECFVYNSDFVEKNFSENNVIKGIFTLGQDNTDIENKISSKMEEIDKLEDNLNSYNSELGDLKEKKGKLYEKEKLEEYFKDNCWNKKLEFDDIFSEVLKGYNRSKEKFANKLLEEYNKKHDSNDNKENLIKRISVIFSENPVRLESIPLPPDCKFDNSEETNILIKPILGKSDIDIGKFWEKLHNSDWVKKGKEYIDNNKCPFCSQSLGDGFLKDIEDYFNDEYQENINKVIRLRKDYEDFINKCRLYYKKIVNEKPRFIDYIKIDLIYKDLESIFNKNLNIISDKLSNPSSKYSIHSHDKYLRQIKTIVDKSNLEIGKYNSTVENIANEKDRLKEDIWNFLVSVPLRLEIEDYVKKLNGLNKAIVNLTNKIKTTNGYISNLKKEVYELERSKTGVKKTIKSINDILKSFGINGFHLEESINNNYKLVREDGHPVDRNLSEGEKTFIVFLYFYHLLKGSFHETNTNTNRVVVIDDPVSSLDSNILFVVTSLIKRLKQEILGGKSNLKQLFLLTHNVYFFRQVTYCGAKDSKEKDKRTFWIVRKKDVSTVSTCHGKNPVKSSYQLLWYELRKEKDYDAMITASACNTMRRILENYFKYMGGIESDDLIEKFSGNDKYIFNSLFGLINAGSHVIDDDESFTFYEETFSKYCDVFRKIFEKSGHISHYDMMMGSE